MSLLLHVIESGPINLELVFEHRMYLPVAFLMLLPVAGVAALPVHLRRPAIAVLVALWIPAATATWKRNITWSVISIRSVNSNEMCDQKLEPLPACYINTWMQPE